MSSLKKFCLDDPSIIDALNPYIARMIQIQTNGPKHPTAQNVSYADTLHSYVQTL